MPTWVEEALMLIKIDGHINGVAMLALLLLCGVCGQGAGQGAPKPLKRRWSLSASLGWSSSHAQDQIENAMIAADLDDATPPGCFILGCTRAVPHPFSTGGTETGMLALSFRVTRVLDLRLQRSSTDLGETIGYNAGSGGFFGGGYLTLNRQVKSVALLAGVNASGLLWFAAGPALEFAAVSTGFPLRSKSATLGAALRAAVRLPLQSRVFLEGAWQYEYVPPVRAGPYVVQDAFTDSTVATFPRTRVSLSHRLLTVGLGVRF
jgi:hypothetical protein